MKVYYLLIFLQITLTFSANAQTRFRFSPVEVPDEAKETLSGLIQSYEIVSFDPKSAVTLCLNGNCSFVFETSDRSWTITLEENNLLDPSYQIMVNGKSNMQRPMAKTYKGYLEGNQNNVVRLALGRNFIDGYIKTDSALLFIKPIDHVLPNYTGRNQFLIFNSVDIINNPDVLDCGVLDETKKLGEQITNKNISTSQLSANSCYYLEIATEADFEFYQSHGSSATTANNSILSELNQVEGLYESTFNMSFIVTFQNVWTTSNDPYSSTTIISTILGELSTKWDNDFGYVKRDYVHYFSGKDPLSARGVAAVNSVGKICEVSTGTYAITAANIDNINIANTTAHEIAHLLDANHLGNTCSSLMCTLTPRDGPDYRDFEFAQATIDEVNNWITNNDGCLVSIVGPDYICQYETEEYTLLNVPQGATIQWVFTYLLSGQGTETCTIGAYTSASQLTLQANVTYNGETKICQKVIDILPQESVSAPGVMLDPNNPNNLICCGLTYTFPHATCAANCKGLDTEWDLTINYVNPSDYVAAANQYGNTLNLSVQKNTFSPIIVTAKARNNPENCGDPSGWSSPISRYYGTVSGGLQAMSGSYRDTESLSAIDWEIPIIGYFSNEESMLNVETLALYDWLNHHYGKRNISEKEIERILRFLQKETAFNNIRVRIYNLNGNRKFNDVLDNGKHQIDLSSLDNGLYIVRYDYGGFTTTKRLSKFQTS